MSPFSPPPPPFYFVIVFLCMTNVPSHHCHNRRVLHQPLIAEPTTTATPTPPFFPIYSSSPPSPTIVTNPSLPITPTNISSTVHQPNQNSSKKKPVVSILVPILSVVLLASVLLFFLHRRRTRGDGTRRRPKEVMSRGSDNHRLFPTDITTSDGRRLSGSAATTTNITTTTTGTTATTATAASSDRLFFGAIANSRRSIVDDVNSGGGAVAIGVGSPYRKLGSPELQPLPLLPRQSRHVYVNAQGGCCSSSEEEEEEAFYSPRENGMTPNTSSRRGLISPEEKFPSPHHYNSNSSPTSPSPSSPSPSPPISTILLHLHLHQYFGGCSIGGGKSSKSKSDIFTSPIDSKFIYSSSLPPPPPPPQPLPKQRSPPKDSNKTNTVSQSSQPPPPPPPPLPKQRSPPKDSNKTNTVPQSSQPPPPPKRRNWVKDPKNSIPITETSCKVPPPPKRRNWVKDPSKSIPIAEKSSKVPPPPPPPPPIGYWETKIQKESKPPPPLVVNHPPTPATAMPNGTEEETPRTKLKPLHWDKVRASSDRVMVWDQLRSSSFQLNEEMIETLFTCNPKTSATKNDSSSDRWQVLPPPSSENRVLDPKKSQNIAILLRALNVTKEEVCEGLLEGNTDSLGIELLETLQKMTPTKEEEIKLREYKDDSSPFKLGPAEKFLKAVLDVPFAFKRVEAMICTTNFDSEVNYLRKSFETLEAACEELRNSRMLMKLLEAVLKTGNRMNVGTNRGDAHAFKLDTLLKLVDIKGTDGKTTLLHFVVQEIIRAEGSRNEKKTSNNFKDEVELKRLGLEVVSNLTNELTNVKKSATMDSDVLSSYVTKLASGVRKVNEVIRLNENESKKNGNIDKFHESMTGFLRKSEDEIIRIQAQESVAISLVKEITEYFHGNSVREEPHPFRIFMVVRDFLSVLDQVCKEVGKINTEQSMAGLASQQYSIPVNPTHPAPVFLRFKPQRPPVDNDDDESSST